MDDFGGGKQMNSEQETGLAIWVIVIAAIIVVALVIGDWALNQ
jgi:hypothetical protein